MSTACEQSCKLKSDLCIGVWQVAHRCLHCLADILYTCYVYVALWYLSLNQLDVSSWCKSWIRPGHYEELQVKRLHRNLLGTLRIHVSSGSGDQQLAYTLKLWYCISFCCLTLSIQECSSISAPASEVAPPPAPHLPLQTEETKLSCAMCMSHTTGEQARTPGQECVS